MPNIHLFVGLSICSVNRYRGLGALDLMAVLTCSRLNIKILWLERLIGIFFRDVLISWRGFISVFVLRLFFMLLTI